MSIEDVNVEQTYDKSFQDLLNSPRTIEAMRRQGIDGSELDPVSQEYIRKQIADREKKRNVP